MGNGGMVNVEPEPRDIVDSMDQLIRLSGLIVTGTVTKVLPAIATSSDPTVPSVETDSLIVIDEVLRGQAPQNGVVLIAPKSASGG